MKKLSSQHLARTIASALFIAVAAGTWDAWWHGAVGRDSFWEPPHLLLYSAIMTAIALGLYGWHMTKEKIWKRLAIVLTFVLVSAPFDELWHQIFGYEDLSTIWVIWSPPHLVLIGTIIAGLIMLLPVLKQDEDPIARRFFGSLAFASILNLAMILPGPLEPTGGWALLGFWGAGGVAFIYVLVLLYAQKWIPGIAGATITAMSFIVLFSIAFGVEIADDIIMKPHDHAPSFLLVFAYIIPAIYLDLMKKHPMWIRSTVTGLLWAAIFYGFSSSYFEPVFQYSLSNMFIAIIASGIGGLAASAMMQSIPYRVS